MGDKKENTDEPGCSTKITPKAEDKSYDIKQLKNGIFHANRWDPVTIHENYKRARLDLMYEEENSSDEIITENNDNKSNPENIELPLSPGISGTPENNNKTQISDFSEWIDRFGQVKYCQLSKKACFRHFNWETTL